MVSNGARWRELCAVFAVCGMKIAIIHSRLNSKGGTQRKVLATAGALQELGHAITVYTMAYKPEKCYPSLLQKLTVITLPGYDEKAQKRSNPFFKFLNYFFYTRSENKEAFRLAGFIARDTEIVCPFDRLAYRVAISYKKKICPIPSVAVMDDIYTKLWAEWRKSQFDASYKLPLRRKIFYWLVDWYETRTYILPHERIVVLDMRTKKWVREYFNKNADIVRNGLEMKDFPYTPHIPPKKSNVKLLSTGIFFVHRRYEDIIHAVKLLQERGIGAVLSIVGGFNGEHERYYKKLRVETDRLNLGDSVFFLGNISDEELFLQYEQNNIYISANHLQSWGLAPFEAIASGMPAIISNSTGAVEVLEDRKHALFVPPKSPEKIAEAVEKLVTKPEMYTALSVQGKRLVESEITWQNTATALFGILQEEVEKKHIKKR